VEGLGELPGPDRLRILVDAYGLDAVGRHSLLGLFPQVAGVMQKFVEGRVAAGDPVFTEMDAQRDPGRWSRILAWLDAGREEFLAALGVSTHLTN
jgi:hypothetical protein